MFTMAKIRDGETYLAKHLSANDYYAGDEGVQGRWVGKGARLLNLEGRIQKRDEAFEQLRTNINPATGGKLTRVNRANRIAFYDFQCSASKSVSIMAAMLGDDELRQAHYESVDVAFKELESFASRQRSWNRQKPRQLTQNIVAARFEHDTSRALDPQLHTHIVMANATYDAETDRWYGLQTDLMCKAIRYAGKVYTNHLAIRAQELGYKIRLTYDRRGVVKNFELSHFSDHELKLYSKRRKEIEAGIAAFEEKYGRTPTAAEIHDIATKTRTAKLAEISTKEVRRQQEAQLSPARLRELWCIRDHRQAATVKMTDHDAAISESISHIFERYSVGRHYHVLTEALNNNLGHADLVELKRALGRNDELKILQHDDINPLQSLTTTAANLAKERWLVDYVNETITDCEPVSCPTKLPICEDLNVDQRRAYEGVLSSSSRVVGIRGAAGTGKSFTLKAIDNAFDVAKINRFYLAPTTSAAAGLRKDGLYNATTLADFLKNVDRSHDARDLKDSFIVLDEAGLASTLQLYSLFQQAKQYDTRILLVGDTRQHSGVEAGDALAILENHTKLQRYDLSIVLRQKQALYKQASEMMGKGNVQGGLEVLDQLGWIQETPNYLEAASERYAQAHKAGTEAILIAPTWNEIDIMNAQVRQLLQQQGTVSSEETKRETFRSYNWTKTQRTCLKNYQVGTDVLCLYGQGSCLKEGASYTVTSKNRRYLQLRSQQGQSYQVSPKALGQYWDVGETRTITLAQGDEILIQKNDKNLKLKNNDTLTVKRVSKSGVILAENAQKQQRTIDSSFKSIRHGYATTSHKSQGASRDEVIVAARNIDAFGRYVSLTRGRYKASFYVPNKANIMDNAIGNTIKNRPAALDSQSSSMDKVVLMVQEQKVEKEAASIAQYSASI